MIFRLDKLHPQNPHDYIDNIPNIVMLIELTNNKLLAAFTQMAFSKEDSADRPSPLKNHPSRIISHKGLILDLTTKVSFINKSQNDTVIYDENALVWGKD